MVIKIQIHKAQILYDKRYSINLIKELYHTHNFPVKKELKTVGS